jgi:hypothetical protein
MAVPLSADVGSPTVAKHCSLSWRMSDRTVQQQLAKLDRQHGETPWQMMDGRACRLRRRASSFADLGRVSAKA